MYKFHFGKGDTISLCADNMRDAVRKFQNLLPGTVFITEDEWQKRKARELEGAIRVAQEAEQDRLKLVA